jgi:RNA polymerase sigma factor (sigma-70 family)
MQTTLEKERIDKTDGELVREFAESASNEALAELARRHSRWIYQSALRQVRDPQMAEDVAQAVFIILAKKAGELRGNVSLGGWLFRVTRYACTHAQRSETRRSRHERKAAAMKSELIGEKNEATWDEVQPRLDEMVSRLGAEDRAALLLRFYQQKSMAEVGAGLAVSEEAAKKRVSRALDRLRGVMRSAGITVPAAALAAGLLASNAQSAPASVETACAAVARTASPAASEIARRTIGGMLAVKLKFAAAALLLLMLVPVAAISVYEIVHSPAEPPPQAVLAPPVNAPQGGLDDVTSAEVAQELAGKWDGEFYRLRVEETMQHRPMTISFAGNHVTSASPGENGTAITDTFLVDRSHNPPWIDIISNGQRYRGIYKVAGNRLNIRTGGAEAKRPVDFVSGPFEDNRLGFVVRADDPDKARVASEEAEGLVQATPTDTLVKIMAAILEGDREGMESSVSFSNPAGSHAGDELRAEFTLNLAYIKLDHAWMTHFNQHARVTGFDFREFPGLEGGIEQLLDRTLAELQPQDVKIDGNAATIRVHVPAEKMIPYGQAPWAQATLQMRLEGGRWVLDGPGTIEAEVSQTPPQSDAMATATKADLALAAVLENGAGKVSRDEFKSSKAAGDSIGKECSECLNDLSLKSTRVHISPRVWGN